MIEAGILGIFSCFLILSLACGISLIWALLAGFILFFFYGLYRHHPFHEMLHLSFEGIHTTKNVLITLALVGILTASWRICGTIPYIVYYAAQWCHPTVILTASFLLCGLISMLMGTSFGTAATMGVICMTMTNSMHIPAVYAGGAILAGVYIGDRCSPMSTSALLVATITQTDIFKNVILMMKTAAVPLLASILVYTVLGMSLPTIETTTHTAAIFQQYFSLHWITALPAVLVVILSCCRIHVKYIMLSSILTAAIIAYVWQHMSVSAIGYAFFFGFHPDNSQLAQLLEGGGILSMARVLAIIFISSSYAGIFSGTGFLRNIQSHIQRLSEKISPFGAILLTSILTGMISCNQTLAIMLTHQLCRPIEPDSQRMAIHLENTAVVTTPLIPWAIACSVVLAVINAPVSSIGIACYLYAIPLWDFLQNYRHRTTGCGKTI